MLTFNKKGKNTEGVLFQRRRSFKPRRRFRSHSMSKK